MYESEFAESDRADGGPPIVVKPSDQRGRRRVEIRGVPVGSAESLADVEEFARRAGLPDADVTDPALVDWRGEGPEGWYR